MRKLLAQKIQQEKERLHKLKAVSFALCVAQAEACHHQHCQDVMLEAAGAYKMIPKWEIKMEEKRPQSEKAEDAKKTVLSSA